MGEEGRGEEEGAAGLRGRGVGCGGRAFKKNTS